MGAAALTCTAVGQEGAGHQAHGHADEEPLCGCRSRFHWLPDAITSCCWFEVRETKGDRNPGWASLSQPGQFYQKVEVPVPSD